MVGMERRVSVRVETAAAVPSTSMDVEPAVHAAEPAAFVVEPRVVRRVIKYHLLSHLGLHIPERDAYAVERDVLLEAVARDELSPADGPLPETVYLIARIAQSEVPAGGPPALLLEYWRRVFRCRVESTVRGRFQRGELSPVQLMQRIDRIGQTEYDEIRAVLRSDDRVLPPRTEEAVYAAFAARFLELRYFAPDRLHDEFPALREVARVESVLAEDVDGLQCFEATRPQGAADPAEDLGDEPLEAPPPDYPSESDDEPRNERRFRAFVARAKKAEERGNLVRAAILLVKAARLTSKKRGVQVLVEARALLDRLVGRLQRVLNFDHNEFQRLAAALRALLERCPHNIWTVEARLLYDLQTVCHDFERELYAIEPVRKLLSLGRRPLRQKVDAPRLVLAYRHLRRVGKRVLAAQVSAHHRRTLNTLVDQALHQVEHHVREQLGPRITEALDRAGCIPGNLPERVAREKLVQELLDKIIEHGHASFGDVRDAISRNAIKLNDLAGPSELVFRDALLRIDRELAGQIKGVYRRAESYLRFFQKLSALLFATWFGRILTKYVLLPFGGAFMLLEFVKHMAEIVAGWFWVPEQHLLQLEGLGSAVGPGGIISLATRPHLDIANLYTILIVGGFFLGLLHSRWFRQTVGNLLRTVGHGIASLWRYLVPLFAVPLVKAIVTSRPALFVRRYILKPALLGLLAGVLLSAAGVHAHESLQGGLVIFALMNVLLNTRAGRDAEEIANEWITRNWYEFRTRILAGIVRAVVDFFRAVVEAVDRFLYTVDEWLRFRSGESRFSLAFKAVAGLVWSVVRYVVRFTIVLLVEPQINPLKHFPVVTVSHKLLLPTIPAFARLLENTLGHDPATSWTLATAVIFGIPGIFGFLAWELKENWRLYEANRPKYLRTAVVGHHGETVLRLLKPGIHSGTLPKLYRKLRRAEEARSPRKRRAARKHHKAIHEVRHALKHYFERELVALLHVSQRWPYRLEVGEVVVSSNSILVEVHCPELQAASSAGLPETAQADETANKAHSEGMSLPGSVQATDAATSSPTLADADDATRPLVLRYDEQSGWLLGSVAAMGWLARLSGEQRDVFRNAVVGLHHRSGVGLVREQILATFPVPGLSYDICVDGLVLWIADREQHEQVTYPLDAPLLEPHPTGESTRHRWPKLSPAQLLYQHNPVSWQQWVATWEACERLDVPVSRLVPKQRVLPPLATS